MPSMQQRLSLVLFSIYSVMIVSLNCFSQQSAPLLLPFQGKLTDSTGAPVPDGIRLILFKIYDQPSGGNIVWPGEFHNASVNNGLVNVILGTKSHFTANFEFDRQLYLEITIDVDGDNTITAADPPMLPRQLLPPVPFSLRSVHAVKAVEAEHALVATTVEGPNLFVSSNTGNVGVGTDGPQEKLEVVGTVKAHKYVGDGSMLSNLPEPSKSHALDAVDGTPVDAVFVDDDGATGLREISQTPAATPSFGKIFVAAKDKQLWYKDDQGDERQVTFEFAHFVEQKEPNTHGGKVENFPTARELNTIWFCKGSSISLDTENSVITLKPGIYYVEGSAPASKCNSHRVSLRQIQPVQETVLWGTNAFSYVQDDGGTDPIVTRSSVRGFVEVLVESQFKIYHMLSTSKGSVHELGIRMTSNDVGPSVFTEVLIQKIGNVPNQCAGQ